MTSIILATLIFSTSESLAVMPITADRVPADSVGILDELLLAEVDVLGHYNVIGTSDIEALLGLERMKDVVGCDDTTCVAEIGGALGVTHILAVRVGVLGDELVVSGKLLAVADTEVIARATVHVPNDESQYLHAMREFALKLFGESADGKTLTMDRFLDAGLSMGDYNDYNESGVSYRAWATERNSESWLLEITKWACTAMVPLMLASALGGENGESRGIFWGLTAGYGLIAGGVWAVDLMNVDGVPPRM